MSFVLYLYGAFVLTFGLMGVAMIARSNRVREEAVVEALKRGEHDQAVRMMLDL
jgi:hypothetical protein